MKTEGSNTLWPGDTPCGKLRRRRTVRSSSFTFRGHRRRLQRWTLQATRFIQRHQARLTNHTDGQRRHEACFGRADRRLVRNRQCSAPVRPRHHISTQRPFRRPGQPPIPLHPAQWADSQQRDPGKTPSTSLPCRNRVAALPCATRRFFRQHRESARNRNLPRVRPPQPAWRVYPANFGQAAFG